MDDHQRGRAVKDRLDVDRVSRDPQCEVHEVADDDPEGKLALVDEQIREAGRDLGLDVDPGEGRELLCVAGEIARTRSASITS